MKDTLTTKDVALAYAAGYAVAQMSALNLSEALCDYLQRMCGIPHSDAQCAANHAIVKVAFALSKQESE